MTFALAALILAAIAAWFVSLGKRGAQAEAAAAESKKEAADAAQVATYEAHVADLGHDADARAERMAALPPPDRARALGRLLNDPFSLPGDPSAPAAPPDDPPRPGRGDDAPRA